MRIDGDGDFLFKDCNGVSLPILEFKRTGMDMNTAGQPDRQTSIALLYLCFKKVLSLFTEGEAGQRIE